jgi:hypothetical protein
MENFDLFCNSLLEESKRFLERAKGENDPISINAFLHASLLLSISSLEAFVNGIAEDFKEASSLTVHEKSFLLEKEISLSNGEFKLDNRLKMSRLIERIEFLFRKFNYSKLDKKLKWWQNLNEGIALRNSLVHPKEYSEIKIAQIESTLKSVIECIDRLFKAIYKKGFPSIKMGLDSKLTF